MKARYFGLAMGLALALTANASAQEVEGVSSKEAGKHNVSQLK